MNWFRRITGFDEMPYEETQALLQLRDGRLSTAHSTRTWGVGSLTMPSLGELRSQVSELPTASGSLRVSCVQADVRRLHADPASRDALFQVASQFNLLEMTAPAITPEHGVTRYASDPTQGPACAIAAGAATIYRNYLVDVAGQRGQRASRQVDCLRALGLALGNKGGLLWTMRNGYALPTERGLAMLDSRLRAADADSLHDWRALLCVGLHEDVEVTDAEDEQQRVSQVFCSAVPVSYSGLPSALWRRFATLVLDATYEATLLIAALRQARKGSGTVFLTRVGGGAFGNEAAWIDQAMVRALRRVQAFPLDVRLVSHGAPSSSLLEIARVFAS